MNNLKIINKSFLTKKQASEIYLLNSECAQFSGIEYSYEPFFEVDLETDLKKNTNSPFDSESKTLTEYYILSYIESEKYCPKLIGFVSAFIFDFEAEISGIIHPDFRKKGLFSTMLTELYSILKNHGISAFYAAIPNLPENKTLSSSSVIHGISHTEFLLTFEKSFLRYSNEISSMNHSASESLNPGSSEFRYTKSGHTNITDSIPEKYSLRQKGKSPTGRTSWHTVCCCHMCEEQSYTNIWDVETKKPYRNMGYGFCFIDYVLKDYFICNEKPLILNVSDRNAPALSLYKKCGFQVKDKIVYYLLK